MNIFLCGFMGAGKSTLLQTLSRENRGCQLIDLDQELVQRYYGSPDRIFSDGEQAFRRRERQFLLDYLERHRIRGCRVMALGGGALEDGRNLGDILASGGLLVHSGGPLSRCAGSGFARDSQRPLVVGRAGGIWPNSTAGDCCATRRAQLTLSNEDFTANKELEGL